VTVERVQIVLDNLRVGGIQRLSLDEAYSLTRTGKKGFPASAGSPYASR